MTPKTATTIAADISAAIHAPFTVHTQRPVSGGGHFRHPASRDTSTSMCGDINTAYAIADHSGVQYFVKLNPAARLTMYEAEAAGLRELAQTHVIRIPQPLCWGIAEDSAYLVMEYIELSGNNNAQNQVRLGQQLAQLHRVPAPRYGWRINNTLGVTPQINIEHDHWPHFWREQRLGFQLSLAAHNGYTNVLQRKGEQLLADIPVFFTSYTPAPSLLHGDLWSGNYGIDAQAMPHLITLNTEKPLVAYYPLQNLHTRPAGEGVIMHF